MNPWMWLLFATVALVIATLGLAVVVGILRPEQAAKTVSMFEKCPRCGYQAGNDVGSFREPS